MSSILDDFETELKQDLEKTQVILSALIVVIGLYFFKTGFTITYSKMPTHYELQESKLQEKSYNHSASVRR